MADSSEKPWSDDPNAPKIPYSLHIEEREKFTGDFLAGILYGIIVVLFFWCMIALLHPVNRARGGIKWGLAIHTALMFFIVTISTGLGLNLQSMAYIDGREFRGGGEFPPGPMGYKLLIYAKAISLVPNITFYMNQWLADGLLLYRCYTIYTGSYWVIAFPCLMYLATLVLSIIYISQISKLGGASTFAEIDFAHPYFAISLSLNVLLTLMIIARVAWHSRNVRQVTGSLSTASGLYKIITTMLVESCALYAATFLLFLVPWWVESVVADTFWPVLIEVQVIAPFLITLRVANQRALTIKAIVSGNPSSIRFGIRGESSGGSETLVDGQPTNVIEIGGGTCEKPDVGVEASTN